MAIKDPTLSPVAVTAILCLVIGGAGGYYGRYMAETAPGAKNLDITAAGQKGAGGARTAGPMDSAMAMPSNADAGAPVPAGPPPTPGAALAKLVRSINAIEKLQGQGLSPEQKKAMLPILTEVQNAGSLEGSAGTEKLIALQKTLSPAQREALMGMNPQRGGQDEGDAARPFASGRNQKALTDLLGAVSK
jgi:hypothetical protein